LVRRWLGPSDILHTSEQGLSRAGKALMSIYAKEKNLTDILSSGRKVPSRI